jgi:hypothetical protein
MELTLLISSNLIYLCNPSSYVLHLMLTNQGVRNERTVSLLGLVYVSVRPDWYVHTLFGGMCICIMQLQKPELNSHKC